MARADFLRGLDCVVWGYALFLEKARLFEVGEILITGSRLILMFTTERETSFAFRRRDTHEPCSEVQTRWRPDEEMVSLPKAPSIA